MTTHSATRPAAPACWLWPTALILAAGETWVDFAARPGLNWALSALATTLACLALRRRARQPLHWPLLLPATLACVLAGGAAVTAQPFLDALIFLGVTGLFATSLLVAGEPGIASRLGVLRLLLSPLAAGGALLLETGRRIREAAGYARAEQSLPAVRGIALALPITLVFALLLSNADPVLASWRQAILIALRDLTFLNRGIAFLIFATLAVGALGIALAPSIERGPGGAGTARPAIRLGRTERLIVLGAVVGLFALFFALQLSHLLGQEAATPGSGVTYAQAAHEGFAELTLAASLCALLLIVLTQTTDDGKLAAGERRLGLALILQSQLLLLSAFHRITVYEQAYGYTELRLFVQAYALVVLVCLALLWCEIRGHANFTRLAQGCAVTAVAALCVMVYWNHAAWIARANIERHAQTGLLDLPYLVRGLGPDAVPELTSSLQRFSPALQQQIRDCLRTTYATRQSVKQRQHAWYEWSYRRAALQAALRREGLQADAADLPATAVDHCGAL